MRLISLTVSGDQVGGRGAATHPRLPDETAPTTAATASRTLPIAGYIRWHNKRARPKTSFAASSPIRSWTSYPTKLRDRPLEREWLIKDGQSSP